MIQPPTVTIEVVTERSDFALFSGDTGNDQCHHLSPVEQEGRDRRKFNEFYA
jgi:hypothetical protein